MTRRTIVSLLAVIGLLVGAPAMASAQEVPEQGGHFVVAPPAVDVVPGDDEDVVPADEEDVLPVVDVLPADDEDVAAAAPDDVEEAEAALAVTGVDVPGLAGLALGLLALGGVALLAARRVRYARDTVT